ncbi:MAG: hypothetical protein ABJG68_03365 [Crocinitomicaceae bacterium]
MRAIVANHKFHLAAIGIIFSIFIYSLFIRQDELNSELSAEQEWITAHVLVTNQIWEEAGGPSAYGFNPVYTYAGQGNKGITSYGGVEDENGDLYYVSYPPLAFIFAYYGTSILGGPDLYSIRALGLIIHFFCAFFIYLIFKNLSVQKNDKIHFAGILASAFYLLSAGTLWMHSTLYFSDMLVQPFIILSLLYSIKLFQSEKLNQSSLLISIGVITFLGCYTEWLAVLLAFVLGITFLILFFTQKKKHFFKAFLIIGLSSILSVSLTVIQYSSIAGFDRFLKVSSQKYGERSGYEDAATTAAGYNIENPDAYQLLTDNIVRNFYTPLVYLLGLLVVFILFLILKKYRARIEKLNSKIGICAILLVAVIFHYLLFFNFNALHNFSNLKTGFLIILLIGCFVSIMEDALKTPVQWVILGTLTVVFFIKIPNEAELFHEFSKEPYYTEHFKYSADQVKKHSTPETYVFSNMRMIQPEYVYRAHHNIFGLRDSNDIGFFMNYFGCNRMDYYVHEKVFLKHIYQYEKIDSNIVLINSMDFNLDKH